MENGGLRTKTVAGLEGVESGRVDAGRESGRVDAGRGRLGRVWPGRAGTSCYIYRRLSRDLPRTASLTYLNALVMRLVAHPSSGKSNGWRHAAAGE